MILASDDGGKTWQAQAIKSNKHESIRIVTYDHSESDNSTHVGLNNIAFTPDG